MFPIGTESHDSFLTLKFGLAVDLLIRSYLYLRDKYAMLHENNAFR